MSNNILYGVVLVVGTILGTVTIVTKGEIGIVVLTLLFIVMSCAEIYWWDKHQKAVYELNIYKDLQAAREAMDAASDNEKDNNERAARETMGIATSIIGTPAVKELLDPTCLCGHPQSEHGSMGVCLHISNCKCVDFKPFRKVEP